MEYFWRGGGCVKMILGGGSSSQRVSHHPWAGAADAVICCLPGKEA